MSFFHDILLPSLIWLVLYVGMIMGARHYLGGVDSGLRKGIFLVASVLAMVIGMAI